MAYDVFKTLKTIVHPSYWVCGQYRIEIKSYCTTNKALVDVQSTDVELA